MLPSQQLEYCETEFMRTSVTHPPMIKRKGGKGKDRASIRGTSSSTNNESFFWSFVISRQTTPLAEKQELIKYTTCLGSNNDIFEDEEDLLLGLEFIVE